MTRRKRTRWTIRVACPRGSGVDSLFKIAEVAGSVSGKGRWIKTTVRLVKHDGVACDR